MREIEIMEYNNVIYPAFKLWNFIFFHWNQLHLSGDRLTKAPLIKYGRV
jgi:hypothetical protein